MKRIILSLIMVTAVASSAVLATQAYFSSGRVLSGNTFATGNVKINEISVVGAPLDVRNLGPGVKQSRKVYFQYNGTLNVDLYIGAGGTSSTEQKQYIADHLNIVITDNNNNAELFNGTASKLSTSWDLLMASVTPNQWVDVNIEFELNSNTPNEHQNVKNTDTRLMILARQAGVTAPGTKPFEDLMNVWNWSSF